MTELFLAPPEYQKKTLRYLYKPLLLMIFQTVSGKYGKMTTD